MLLELSNFLPEKKGEKVEGGESGGVVRLVDCESIGPVQKGGGGGGSGEAPPKAQLQNSPSFNQP